MYSKRFLPIIIPLMLANGPVRSQVLVALPATPDIDTVPAPWRGHNEPASSPMSQIQTNDYYSAVSRLNPGIIRWPGGNVANNYHWQQHISDLSQLHIVNFRDYVNAFGAQMQMVVNFGNGSAHEAAEFVRFCNSTAPFYQSWRTNVFGDPAPLNVKYWEVGNESTDAWSFGWSWLGHTDQVNFQTGQAPITLYRPTQDSLYYYGGNFWRQGWVPDEGGLNMQTAILGTSRYYSQSVMTDTIKVEYPEMDTLSNNAVRVYLTRNMDMGWAHSTTDQQALYDSVANPTNLLTPSEYHWNTTHVVLEPIGGIDSSDAILIEYNSTGHDGAFTFRDSMKAADPSIEIGYNVKVISELADSPQFQQDFATHPPDFMIKHPYSSSLTLPAMQNGLFSEVAYVAEKKLRSFRQWQQLWNQRKDDWGIPDTIGLSLTEWNIALYDDAPEDHPVRGISCGVYVADFWAQAFQFALADSFDLRANNHFALSAIGQNFIHLFHPNNPFETSVEGRATTMVMETVGSGMFPVDVSDNPNIEVLSNSGNIMDTLHVPAVLVWAGISDEPEYRNLLLINRDDEAAHSVQIDIPTSWNIDSVFTETMHGSMIDSSMFYAQTSTELTGQTYPVSLPAFSVTSVRLKMGSSVVNVGELAVPNGIHVFPNPTESILTVDVPNVSTIAILSATGHTVMSHRLLAGRKTLDISALHSGVYLLRVKETGQAIRFVKE